MVRTTSGVWARPIVLMATAALSLWVGLRLGGSPAEAIHITLVPVVAAYALLYRPRWARRLSLAHLAYFVTLAVLVAVYMTSMAKANATLAVDWGEWVWAVYLLGAVHVVVGLVALTSGYVTRGAVGLVFARPAPVAARVVGGVCRVVLLLAVIVPYLTATFMTHWVKFDDRTDPAQHFGPGCQQVAFEATDGVRLVGWLIPAAEPSDATVVIAPSRDPARTATLLYAGMLRRHFNVLIYDPRGQHDSGGHARSAGPLEARDVIGAVTFLKTHHANGSRHVFGFGVGEGATALAVAAARDDRIEAVVLDSATSGIPPALSHLTSRWPAPIGRAVTRVTLLVASAELGIDLLTAPAAYLPRIAPRPVLIVRGLSDSTGDASDLEELALTSDGPVSVYLIPEAGSGEPALQAYDEYGRYVYALFESVRRGWDPLLPSERS